MNQALKTSRQLVDDMQAHIIESHLHRTFFFKATTCKSSVEVRT